MMSSEACPEDWWCEGREWRVFAGESVREDGRGAEELSCLSKSPKLLRIGVEDRYPHAGPYDSLMDDAGLTWDKVLQRIRRSLL